MVDEWQEIKLHFCNYVQRQTPSCRDCNELHRNNPCDQPRDPGLILGDWKNLGYSQSKAFKSALTFRTIQDAIARGNPIQAYFRGVGIAPHVVLIAAALKTPQLDDALVIFDPARKQGMLITSLELMNWGQWTMSWEISR